MILETERTLTSLVPMEEIAPPEVDIQEEEVPQGVDDQKGPFKGRSSR